MPLSCSLVMQIGKEMFPWKDNTLSTEEVILLAAEENVNELFEFKT